MEEKQVRRKKRAFVALLFPALLFFLVSPFAVPASALTFEFSAPRLVDYGGLNRAGTAWFNGDVDPTILSALGSVILYSGFDNAERYPSGIPYDDYTLAKSGPYIGELYPREFIKPAVVLSGNNSNELYQFYYEFQRGSTAGVYVLHLCYDDLPIVMNGVFKTEFYYTSYVNLGNSVLSNILYNKFGFADSKVAVLGFSYDTDKGDFSGNITTAPITVIKEQLSTATFKYTVYFDLDSENGDFEGDLGTTYTDFDQMHLVINIPFMVAGSTNYSFGSFLGSAQFPTTYEVISHDQMQEQVGQISQQIDQLETTIETSINNQTTQIISGVSNVIQEQLIDNTDPERQAINQEAETNIDRLKDVGDQYESQNAIVDEARRNLESIAPVTLPPEASEFISTTGEILSSPWILTLTTIGLTLGIIRIILIGVYH